MSTLTLGTVVDNSAKLNVGDARLDYLSYNMLFDPNTGPGGLSAPYTEQGSWTSVGPGGCGGNPVTVNATIEANWDPNGGPGWTWQDLRAGFATALGAVMQAVANPTAYENYSYTELPTGDGVLCVDPQFLDWGHYIPAGIQITAYDNDNDGAQIAQVTVTYSTEDQTGGDLCAALLTTEGTLLPVLFTDSLSALFGAGTTLACGLVDG